MMNFSFFALLLVLGLCILQTNAIMPSTKFLILKTPDKRVIRYPSSTLQTISTQVQLETSLVPKTSSFKKNLSTAILWICSIYSNILLFRVMVSVFPDFLTTNIEIGRPLKAITEPYLNIFRKFVPKVYNTDISAIVGIMVVDTIASTLRYVAMEEEKEKTKNEKGIQYLKL